MSILASQGHIESLLSCFIQDPVLFYIKETTNIGLARKHPGQLPLRSANLWPTHTIYARPRASHAPATSSEDTKAVNYIMHIFSLQFISSGLNLSICEMGLLPPSLQDCAKKFYHFKTYIRCKTGLLFIIYGIFIEYLQWARYRTRDGTSAFRTPVVKPVKETNKFTGNLKIWNIYWASTVNQIPY